MQPQKEKVQAFLKEVRAWLKTAKSLPPVAVIAHLNPRLRGWSNYYKKVTSKNVLAYVDHQVWRAVWHWCLSRHPNEAEHWVLRKYFKPADRRSWAFFGTVQNDFDEGKTDIFLFRTGDVLVKPHIKVVGAACPDDPDFSEYWCKRKSKFSYLLESLPNAFSV